MTKPKKRNLQKHKAETSAEGKKTKHKDEAGKQSQRLPAVRGLTSQGSAHETATELNEQNMLFPKLMNCNHPLDFIVAKLTTREHREEMAHINTIRELSIMDLSNVERLPIISPKISHARAVLQEYQKLIAVQVEVQSDVTGS